MSQFAGWLSSKYVVGRAPTAYEENADLGNFDSSGFTPVDRGIIRVDEACLEYVDRHFLYRGWAAMGGAVGSVLALIFGGAILRSDLSDGALDYGLVPFYLAIIAFLVFSYTFLISKDVLRHQYYPSLFNREEGVVYFFTGRDDGYVKVPWGDIKFIIGRDKPFGPDEGMTYDLKALIMDGGKISHVFAIGSDCGSSPATVLAHWEMIRRFMEGGIGALPFPPLQLYTSTIDSFRNAFVIHVSSAGRGLMWIALPLTLPWAIFRYLVMKTCRRPVWPAAVARQSPNTDSRVLRAPPVYGGVDRSHGKDDLLASYWISSIQEARSRDGEVKAQLCREGVP
ncbi:DUF6708 domain-containing protein [Stenotrophomonas sp. PFBMAA-4]|uniref:DUF6708 domain-containing protein n=1 Tax=Stenotrophomonas sp. PFBMAA-4 TaxID=3043301 RepID=UPI0024B498D1|nr:DUF6708 domain-containing protein [Stenotrophomonas sp. PFBMAA-4]MDI9275234.1 hypothetical protein [Stenotrophomonas sp. PFBMAA-4]